MPCECLVFRIPFKLPLSLYNYPLISLLSLLVLMSIIPRNCNLCEPRNFNRKLWLSLLPAFNYLDSRDYDSGLGVCFQIAGHIFKT